MPGYTVRRKSEQSQSPAVPFDVVTYKKSVDGVVFTPAIAKYLLEHHNKRNRHISPASVDSIARDLRADRYYDNGERVTFGEDGNLVSGQHRLMACVLTGIPFVSDVKFGIDENGRLTADSGRSRKAGDNIAIITGDKHANQKATLVNGVRKILDSHRDKISAGFAMALIEDFADGLEVVMSELGNASIYKLNPCAAAFVLAATAYPNKTRELLKGLVESEVKTSAGKAIARYAQNGFNEDTDTKISAKVLSAIYDHMEGNEILQLTSRPKDLEVAIDYFLSQIKTKHPLNSINEMTSKYITLSP